MTGRKYKIPCTIIRGGTSKGVYFMREDLPCDEDERDRVLLRIMGSPDRKQIDGLGGATSVTSKIAIIEKSKRMDADVDYTFVQIGVDKPIVSVQGNCGNISSGVGPFAIEKGLVKITEPITKVKVFNTNTKKVIIEEVHVENGNVKYCGDYKIAGVPGSASPIKMRFVNPIGTLQNVDNKNALLPTGNALDLIETPWNKSIEISIVDAVNCCAFVRAEDVGIISLGSNMFDCISDETVNKLEELRGLVAEKLGLCSDYKKCYMESPGIPKLAVVAKPRDYVTNCGDLIKRSEYDILAFMLSMQKLHPTYALTCAMCTAVAAKIENSVVGSIVDSDNNEIRIANPSGIIPTDIVYKNINEKFSVDEVIGYRTANLIMDGMVYVE